MIRVAIVEDQLLLVKMMRLYVNSRPGLEMVGEAHNGEEAVRMCLEKRPDVVLMDVSMPVMDGIAATREITNLLPETSVLILSAHSDDEHVFYGVKAGAKGYLHKGCSPEELEKAIRTVHGGDTIMSPEIAERTLQILGQRKEDPGPKLTPREIEIIRAVAQGKSRRDIAKILYISENTVRNHVTNIYKKLQIYDRTQAVLYAVQHGLVDPRAVNRL